MNPTLRIEQSIWDAMHRDLSRPHPYAAERVLFLACKISNTSGGILLLAKNVYPVNDENYLRNATVGAVINSTAVRMALEIALREQVSVFHVHKHEHVGAPRFSHIDKRCNQQLVPDFFNVRPNMPHGAVVLSKNMMAGECWFDRKNRCELTRLEIVGRAVRRVPSWST